MTSFEGESSKIVDKFRSDNFYHWKAKMELLSASLDLQKIVDEREETPSLEASIKEKKDFKNVKRRHLLQF